MHRKCIILTARSKLSPERPNRVAIRDEKTYTITAMTEDKMKLESSILFQHSFTLSGFPAPTFCPVKVDIPTARPWIGMKM